MHQVLQFAVNHWLLVAAFVVVLILIGVEEMQSSGGAAGGVKVTPQQAVHLINQESAAVLDIRGSELFDAGHIVNAIHIAEADLERGIKKVEKYRNKPLIVTCASGQKAGAVAAKLRKQGFAQARVLAGGLSAWEAASLPLVATKKKKNKKGA